MRLFGIETEYGIARHDRDEIDPVVESMELVRAYLMARSSGAGITAGKIRTKMPGAFAFQDCAGQRRGPVRQPRCPSSIFVSRDEKRSGAFQRGPFLQRPYASRILDAGMPHPETVWWPTIVRGSASFSGRPTAAMSRSGTRSSISTRTTPIFTATAMAATTIILWRARSRFPGL